MGWRATILLALAGCSDPDVDLADLSESEADLSAVEDLSVSEDPNDFAIKPPDLVRFMVGDADCPAPPRDSGAPNGILCGSMTCAVGQSCAYDDPNGGYICC